MKGFLGGSIVGSGLVYVLGDTSDGTMSAAGREEEAPVELGVLDGRDSELIRYLCVQFSFSGSNYHASFLHLR